MPLPFRKNLLLAYRLVIFVLEFAAQIPLMLVCLASRFSRRPFDVGLGPETLINNVYHKKALNQQGYRAQTFITTANFLSNDYDINLNDWNKSAIKRIFIPYYLFLRAIFNYKVLFIYFNGGPLYDKPYLRKLEPFLYKLANVKVVVMPYGSDVQDMTRSNNLHFKDAMCKDYPGLAKDHRRIAQQIDRWSRHADWVISGCEWVDYTYYWNTLMSGHFSIDLDRWQPGPTRPSNGPLRILHAPNHAALKGTTAVQAAVSKLQSEGLDIELVLLRGVPNSEIQATIERVDLVADQFVIGWYAMFALEALCLGKPVLCYLRNDLLELYDRTGVMTRADIPLINTPIEEIENRLRWAYLHREELNAIGERGRPFVQKYHSTEAIGIVFRGILEQLGVHPVNLQVSA